MSLTYPIVIHIGDIPSDHTHHPGRETRVEQIQRLFVTGEAHLYKIGIPYFKYILQVCVQ